MAFRQKIVVMLQESENSYNSCPNLGLDVNGGDREIDTLIETLVQEHMIAV